MTAFVFDDGGRGDAGFKGSTGDCVVRAIAIATGLPYREVYDELHNRSRDVLATARPGTKKHARLSRGSTSPRAGVRRSAYDPYLKSLGWTWTPTMQIGSGTTVHLRDDELPSGTIIVRVSKHMLTMIDGVIHDTFMDDRGGTRAVYGYWSK